LGEGPVRLDSTAASGYAQVSPDGLFQFGHSKDHRPDLPQLKVQLATLDPLGLPLSSTIVSGERADDGLYVPEIKKVQKTLQSSGLLYVGDCKMAALETRAYLAKSKDYYLCPLSQVQMPSEKLAQLLAPVWTGQQNLSALYQPTPSPSPGEVAAPEVLIGQGYSLERAQKAVVAGEEHTWTERLLVVRSTKWQQAQQHSLQARLEKAQAQIEELNKRKRGKRRWPNRAALEQAVQAILDHFKVAKLVQISYVESLIVHARRRYQTRAADEVVQWSGQVVVAVDAPALVQAEAELGWRVYATNHRESELSLQKAILAYRSEYLVEHNFGRLKGRGLSLQPMYLAIDTRVKGLVRLLTLALRVLSLVEFEVRRQLAEQAESLSGLYAGQPKRSTTRPTTESLLKAFSGLNLSKVVVAGQVHYHVTPLTALQQRILALLGFSTDLYTTLTLHSYQPFLE
jgi:transposase